MHGKVVLYDCHSIRSVLPRLFEGTLPVFNLGTNGGESGDPDSAGSWSARSWPRPATRYVVNGRFKGGWITRHYGQPQSGVHAMQMELANRGYMREPDGKGEPDNWPVPYDADFDGADPRHAARPILDSRHRSCARR